MVTAVPLISAHDRGTDTIAARDDGELAVRLLGDRRILVLHHSNDYQSSEIVDPEAEGVPMAFAWDNEALLIAVHDGALHRVEMDGTATELTRVQGTPVAIATNPDSVHVLCASSPGRATGEDYNRLWSIPLADTSTPLPTLANSPPPPLAKPTSPTSEPEPSTDSCPSHRQTPLTMTVHPREQTGRSTLPATR